MMTYSDLVKVNATLPTRDIKGKEYVEVNNRVLAFRQLFPEGTITTELVSNVDGVCVMKASVFNGTVLLSTGLAYERESASYINKTSYIENCETSAVGRALGFLGIGISTSIASAEEVSNAIRQQESTNTIDATAAEALRAVLAKADVNIDKLLKMYKIKQLEDLTAKQYGDIIRLLNQEKK